MKHFFKVALVVALTGGVLAAAVASHESHQNQLQAQAQNAAQRQAVIEAVDAHNLQTAEAQASSYQAQLSATKSSLCDFISQHVSAKTVPYPTECQ
jgi:pectin methylesterase-like acyl-CoA thioesterase